MGIVELLMIAIVVLMIVSAWKINTKADKPGWACLVPIYSTLVTLDIVGKRWWWLLMFFIPVINIVFAIMMINLLAKSFGKGSGFTVGLIFLPFIFYPILGLGEANYKGPAGLKQ